MINITMLCGIFNCFFTIGLRLEYANKWSSGGLGSLLVSGVPQTAGIQMFLFKIALHNLVPTSGMFHTRRVGKLGESREVFIFPIPNFTMDDSANYLSCQYSKEKY